MKFAVCVLAIQNEFCLEETLLELRRQGAGHCLIVSPTHYWTTGERQFDCDKAELVEIATRTGSTFMPAFFGGKSPIALEAEYRNEGLAALWHMGYPHVIFVDADEYWLPGAIDELKALVEVKDQSYQFLFTPTVGVPGYPVDTADSRGLVYVPHGVRLKWGRATPDPHGCGSRRVLHFSTTRKTREEVVLKCRRSAHYVEPGYEFERWFKEVLPQARPGLRDVHMYASTPNIWPVLRDWTAEEWSVIPNGLKPYLAYGNA